MKLTQPIESLAPSTVRPEGWLGPSTLVPAYVLAIILGFFAFQSGSVGRAGNEFSRQRAIFASVNAATLTGFVDNRSVNDYTPQGQWIALGLMVIGTLFCLVTGGTAVTRIAKLPWRDGTILLASIIAIAISMAAGACLADPTRSLFEGVFLGVSAIGNCGLYVGQLPRAGGLISSVILLPLAVAGGLSIPVWLDMGRRLTGRPPLSRHSLLAIGGTAVAYLAFLVIFLIALRPALHSGCDQWRTTVAQASQLAINTRGMGLPFRMATYWPRTQQWLGMLAMLVGAAPGGTAGGIGVTTIFVLAHGTREVLQRRKPARLFGVALVWLLIYISCTLVATLALLASSPALPADRLLFLAVSAMGNVGLSHDILSLSDPGYYVLSMTMLAGRIAPLLVLWWLAESTPEADIAVG